MNWKYLTFRELLNLECKCGHVHFHHSKRGCNVELMDTTMCTCKKFESKEEITWGR